jgi:hypothetical protein
MKEVLFSVNFIITELKNLQKRRDNEQFPQNSGVLMDRLNGTKSKNSFSDGGIGKDSYYCDNVILL